jgi:hypothetical protein
MSIVEIVGGGSLMDLSAMLTRDDFNVDKKPEPILSSGFEGCPDVLKVFSGKNPKNIYENDFTSFLVSASVYDVQFVLFKDCEEVAILNNDELGEFYAKGYWKQADGFTFTQSNYTGFKIDWNIVFNSFGYGYYTIETQFTFGETSAFDFCSCKFLLQEYSKEKADKTIKIRTIQNGTILDSFDYLGMDWEQSWRLDGFFGYPQDKLESDNYLNSNRDLLQIQDKLFKEYTLQTDFIADCYKYIFDDILLSNTIFIDDFNIKNAFNLKNVDVIPTESNSEYFIESTETYKEITFESRSRKKVKRNVK